MQLTEWPSLTRDDEPVLRERMAIAVEPGMSWTRGNVMIHEEDVVVRADGPELLSRRAPRELPIIG